MRGNFGARFRFPPPPHGSVGVRSTAALCGYQKQITLRFRANIFGKLENIINYWRLLLKIRYDLEDAGWATVNFEINGKVFEFPVSYLHDSLKNLAESLINIKNGSKSECIVFMSEPGEHQLVLSQEAEEKLNIEMRWYDDWASWNMFPNENFSVVFSAKCYIKDYQDLITHLLKTVLEKYGLKGYKDKWVEHDFPLSEYEKIIAT